jgi:DNA-binding NtrC family response regulator
MRRMLVVDDEPSICFALGAYFGLEGFEVDTAYDLEKAKELLSNGHYSVVISDLCLSPPNDTGGLEVVRYVQEQSPDTRIVVFTAYGSPELEDELREKGVDVLLQKPKPLPEVAEIVSSLVGQ